MNSSVKSITNTRVKLSLESHIYKLVTSEKLDKLIELNQTFNIQLKRVEKNSNFSLIILRDKLETSLRRDERFLSRRRKREELLYPLRDLDSWAEF